MSVWRSLSRKSRNNKQAKSKRDHTTFAQGPAFEPLEPRLLLSADLTYATLSDGIFDLKSELPGDGSTPAILTSMNATDGESVQASSEDRAGDTNSAYRVPQLPGLELVDPSSIDRIAGQVFYLDFDGARDVIYNGPVTVGPFDVPAFSLEGTPLAGQEQVITISWEGRSKSAAGGGAE